MPSVFITPAGIAAGPSFGVGDVLKILDPIIVGNSAITKSSAVFGIDLLPGGAVFPSGGSVQGVSCRAASVFQFNTNTAIGTALFFNFAATFQQDSGSTRTLGPIYSLISIPTITANNGALTCADLASTIPALSGLYFAPTLNSIGGPTSTLATVACVEYASLAIGSNWTVTNSYGLKFYDAAGAGTLTNQIAVDIQALVKATNNIGVRSNIASGATNYFLQGTGTAQCAFAGLFTTYNNVLTTGWGIPGINGYARAATGRTAAVTSVATFTPAADGTFVVSANVLVTTSTTHSFSVTCAYTDEGNTARTLTLGFTQLSGATLITLITNTTGLGPYESLVYHIRCKAATAITIATTGTFTTVTYNVEGNITQIA